jgi:hypothetical protein
MTRCYISEEHKSQIVRQSIIEFFGLRIGPMAPPSSAEVEERIELYLYSLSGLS